LSDEERAECDRLFGKACFDHEAEIHHIRHMARIALNLTMEPDPQDEGAQLFAVERVLSMVEDFEKRWHADHGDALQQALENWPA
jgi:hypothetical protein